MARSPCSSAYAALASTTAAAASLTPEALPAVTEPLLSKAARSLARSSAVTPGRAPLGVGPLVGRHRPGKIPAPGGEGRPPVTLGGEGVLVSPGHPIVSRHVLRGDGHVAVIEWVGERSAHGIHGDRVLHAL